jgi:hypothetical protein
MGAETITHETNKPRAALWTAARSRPVPFSFPAPVAGHCSPPKATERSPSADSGNEPRTCRTLRENHTTRPSSQMSITSTAAFSRATSPVQPFVACNIHMVPVYHPIVPLCHCLSVILPQWLSPNRPMLAFPYPPTVQVSARLPHSRIHTRNILIFAGHDALHSAFPSHPTQPRPTNKNSEAAEHGIAGFSLDGAVAYVPTFIVMSQTST